MTDSTERPRNETPPVDRLSQIWRRVHEHKVAQWTVAYVALAYAFQHGIILVGESLDWPHAIPRVSLLLFVLGLPLVMTFAWYQGARASRNFSQAELSILTALLVVGSLVFYVFMRPEAQVRSPVAQEASVTAARQAAASPKGAISVVVLPFSNMSGDASQEFFSDGMTEEITAALAKVPDLRVVARTSAFEFKGKNIDSDAVYAYSELEELSGTQSSKARIERLERALVLDPDNPEPLQSYSINLAALGFTEQALKVRQHLLEVEPFVPVYRGDAVRLLNADGQFEAAIKVGMGLPRNAGINHLAQAYAALGRFGEAADALAKANPPDEKSRQWLATAIRILRGAPANAPQNDRPELGILDWIYIYRNAPEQLAKAYQVRAQHTFPIAQLNGLQFSPAYAAMRKTPQFKQYVRDSGALDYWRANGWPPQCHPATGDDFDCS